MVGRTGKLNDIPGKGFPDLPPPPETEEEEIERRRHITLAELAEWYGEHGFSLTVELKVWDPDGVNR